MKISKITLGTAQLGSYYGIANVYGKPDYNSSIKILNFAWKNGINSFDTSPSYGNSEEIIGSFIKTKTRVDINNLAIISKLPMVKLEKKPTFNTIYNFIKDYIAQSLINLKIKKIPIYLLHHASDIYLKDGIVIECLTQLRNEGLIDRIGISIYDPEEVETSLTFKEISVIQIPINIFDQRLIKTGLLEKLKKKEYIIFARSIYLQGLFFIPPEKLPKNLKNAEKPLLKIKNLSNEYNIEIAKLAFLFIRNLPEISSLVIGVENLEQIKENINFLREKPLSGELFERIYEEFSDLSEKIINPSLWKI